MLTIRVWKQKRNIDYRCIVKNTTVSKTAVLYSFQHFVKKNMLSFRSLSINQTKKYDKSRLIQKNATFK